MKLMRLQPRWLSLGILITLAVVASIGLYLARKDIDSLRHLSRDNFLWTATQTEVEFLHFQRSLAILAVEESEEAAAQVKHRFELLLSRVDALRQGRTGEVLQSYDADFDAIPRLEEHLRSIDPTVMAFGAADTEAALRILDGLTEYHREIRAYTLRVVRGDTANATVIRDRILMSAQLTGIIGLVAVAVSILALVLITRENMRQREMAAISRRSADEAEVASRAKSRFLTMMSHEMRNPLNGLLGPLALLEQSDLGQRQLRLVEQAQSAGRAMLGMLTGLLEWGEMQDNRLVLKREPFRVQALATALDEVLNGGTGPAERRAEIRVQPDAPELFFGDFDRLRQIFLNLAEYVAPVGGGRPLQIDFRFAGGNLVGDIAFDNAEGAMDWKLDLLTGMSDSAVEPFSTDALGPLIARGLIAAARGMISLGDGAAGLGVIRVTIPAEPVRFEKIRVHLETRSSALAAIYQAALKSDRVAFNTDPSAPADIVLVDTTSVGELPLMTRLRDRFPDALFVSLGLPNIPGFFDDIVEAPYDMVRLRKSILGRLAS